MPPISKKWLWSRSAGWSKRPRRSVIAEQLDAERRLALSYVGTKRRPAVETLWKLDANLGHVLSSSRQPLAAQLRLAWWRDALRRLDEYPAPAEPLLQDVETRLLSQGITGVELSQLVDGWEHLLAADTLAESDLAAYAGARGAALFSLSARLLGGRASPNMEAAGRAWALADLARHSSRPAEAQAALGAAAKQSRQAPAYWPAGLRPLGMLAVLAQRDVGRADPGGERAASPRRMLRMLAHRLTGR